MMKHRIRAIAIMVAILAILLAACGPQETETPEPTDAPTEEVVVTDEATEEVVVTDEATEEAIKQALLFAGASVRSVQQMTNGLLLDDHLEIRATGEVNTIQLVDEVYEDGIVTVTIRADIFAQQAQCSAADYTKKLSTTYFPIRFQAQASDGQIHELGKVTALRFKDMMDKITPSLTISHIEPYVFDWQKSIIFNHSHRLYKPEYRL